MSFTRLQRVSGIYEWTHQHVWGVSMEEWGRCTPWPWGMEFVGHRPEQS